MTPSARLQAAIEVLDAVESSNRSAAGLLDAYFRRRRYAGSKDRRWVRDMVWAVLRRRGRLDWWIGRTGLGPTPRLQALALHVIEGGDPELFDGEGYGPAALDPHETLLADALVGAPLDHHDMPEHSRLEFPEWLEPALRRTFGDELEREMAALNVPAPVDLRVNSLKASREQAMEMLSHDGIEAEPTLLSPLGLRIHGRARLGDVGAYRKGVVEVQDEGSQLVAEAVGAEPGMTVVDYCAGAGGKTLALAAAMECEGRLVACDISDERMANMPERLKRASVDFVETRIVGQDEEPWVQADRVLADAPCTGSGLWRRRPEDKWRLTPERLAELEAEQGKILNRAMALVRPGGKLVYATCSLLREENQDRIPRADETWFLTPGGYGTDGFFIAVITKP